MRELSYEVGQFLGFDFHPWSVVDVELTQLNGPLEESHCGVKSLENLF